MKNDMIIMLNLKSLLTIYFKKKLNILIYYLLCDAFLFTLILIYVYFTRNLKAL